MLRNYIVIALRLLVKNKIFSLINILGLSTGIACCILISFESFRAANRNPVDALRNQ
jgi:hypothetical protein